MRFLQCYNCGCRRGFKRALGLGTLVMIVLTFGLWILMIPFYPSRCIVCGGSENAVAEFDWRKFVVVVAVLLFVVWEVTK